MKRAFFLIPLFVIGCANPKAAVSQQAVATPDMLEQAMNTAKVSGICATHEKLFKYAQDSGDKAKIAFAKDFFTFSASEIGRTPQGLIDLCQDTFAASSRMRDVINKYK